MSLFALFYHIKNSQGTKTYTGIDLRQEQFYHIKNSQGTKTCSVQFCTLQRFITLRIHRVPKPQIRLFYRYLFLM